MKKSMIALLTALAILIGVLSVTIFASLSSSSGQAILGISDAGDVDSAIIAGYTTSIDTNGTLGADEGWVLPGRLTDGETVDGTFGVQWNKDSLYLVFTYAYLDGIKTLTLNDNPVSNPSPKTNFNTTGEITAELEISMLQIGLGGLAAYDHVIPISIELKNGGKYSGHVKLSSVNWNKTTNVSSDFRPSIRTPEDMTATDLDKQYTSRPYNARFDTTSKVLNLYDRYSDSEPNVVMGGKARAYYSWEGLVDNTKTSYISFDFKAVSMPEYELAEAVGGYHFQQKVLNFGFTWQLSDYIGLESGKHWANVTKGGIINTEDDLYLVVGGHDISTLKLNKKVGDTFNVGLAWHKNGDLSVYIDGVEKGYYVNKYNRQSNTNLTTDGIWLFSWRDETHERVPGDDIDLEISNVAFGTGLPETPVKVLTAEDISATAEEVIGNLVLPQYINEDSVFTTGEEVTWTSSDPNVINDDGTVIKPTNVGAVKVTMTATDNAGNKKDIDVIVLRENHSSDTVSGLLRDITPATNQKTEITDPNKDVKALAFNGDIFHFDSNNNSLVYDRGVDAVGTPVNVIKLTDLDNVSRLNRESISIWTSNDNTKYTRVEGNYKLLHLGKDWYLYNFTANARYIKVNYTLWDEEDSDFANALSDIMSVYYEDVFGANEGEFQQPATFEITNYTGKKQQDYVWCIPKSSLNNIELTKLRVMDGSEYLYHYSDGDNLYVRIPELDNNESVNLKILYGNNDALDISDKEAAYEVTYGTREMYKDNTQRILYVLEADTELSEGAPLVKDVLFRYHTLNFYRSYDGGMTWSDKTSLTLPQSDFPNDDSSRQSYFAPYNHGGFAYYDGVLYWSGLAYQAVYTDATKTTVDHYNYKKYITYSLDGGETWEPAKAIDSPTTVVGETGKEPDSYANGIVPSTADGRNGNKIDIIFPVAVTNTDGNFVSLFLVSRDGGGSWEYLEDEVFYMESEQNVEGGLSESTILENKSGELVWYCRYQTKDTCTFVTSVSTDGGNTWEEPKRSTVFATNTQPIMEKIDGDPFFVWGGNNAFGGNTHNRMPLNVAVSYDGLKTFRNIQNVYAETFLENYSQSYQSAYVTNPSMVKFGKDLIIAYDVNHPDYKVFTRVTDYENWFYRTKGIYDSFDSQNTKYEGWIPYMGETSLKREDSGNYALQILPHSAISRSVPYLQNGKVSLNVWVDGTSTFTMELQSAYSPVIGKAAPVSLKVENGQLYWYNDAETDFVDDGLSLTLNRWNTITIDLGLAKGEPTASVSVNGSDPFSFEPTVEVMNRDGKTPIPTDYVCYIAVNTGDASVSVDEVLVQSNLDAINYTKEIREVDVAIITHPTSQEKGVGETATFRVAAQGYGVMYQWYVSEDSGSNWTAIEGATSATYTTEPVDTVNNGYQYRCIVKDRNENEKVSDPATLTVDYISVTITWGIDDGKMAFICDENGKWTAAFEGADEITVTNESDVAMLASVTYQPIDGYNAITGSFDQDDDPDTASKELAENETITWTLKLSSEGEANQGLENTPIGTVTLRIQKATNNP